MPLVTRFRLPVGNLVRGEALARTARIQAFLAVARARPGLLACRLREWNCLARLTCLHAPSCVARILPGLCERRCCWDEHATGSFPRACRHPRAWQGFGEDRVHRRTFGTERIGETGALDTPSGLMLTCAPHSVRKGPGDAMSSIPKDSTVPVQSPYSPRTVPVIVPNTNPRGFCPELDI